MPLKVTFGQNAKPGWPSRIGPMQSGGLAT